MDNSIDVIAQDLANINGTLNEILDVLRTLANRDKLTVKAANE